MKVFQKVIDGLVEDWKDAWKWLSVQSTVIVTFIATFAVTEKESFDSIINVLPEDVRKFMVPLTGAMLIYLRLKDQGRNKGNTNGQ